MRLLLVEDEKKLAAFVKRGIEQECGCVVDAAYDGEEGLHYARTYEYDAIILDLMLPRKDGLEVLSELRAQLDEYSLFQNRQMPQADQIIIAVKLKSLLPTLRTDHIGTSTLDRNDDLSL